MPSWNQLIDELDTLTPKKRNRKLRANSVDCLKKIGQLRGGRHVIFYSSAFLQKPQAPFNLLQITGEDLNAFMCVLHGHDVE